MTKIFEEKDLKEILYRRPADCHKGNFGYIALVGGSLPYSGAIRLAAMANCAMRAGAGVVSVAAPDCICPAIAPQILEATLFPLASRDGYIRFDPEQLGALARRMDLIAFGMGIGNTAQTALALGYLLQNYEGTLIVDADGLNALASMEKETIKNSRPRLLLTPHMGEFSRLSGIPAAEASVHAEECARALASELGAVVVLKGPQTVVTDGEDTWLVRCGCPGMATAGSGDVLSGILAAVCGYNPDRLLQAAAAGAYVNGKAGELAMEHRSDITMVASDTAQAIEELLRRIRAAE